MDIEKISGFGKEIDELLLKEKIARLNNEH
jgi:hypothetical protein